MPYLIDGHNLIPKVPGLDLGAVDDETQLIVLLQDYCRRKRKQVEVMFDNAPPGQARARNYGAVIARFARAGQTADDLIRARLGRLERQARNWTVVSSDHQVQAAARAAKAQVLSSDEFARLLLEALRETPAGPSRDGEAGVSAGEVDDWLRLFGGEGEAEKPDKDL
jgi:predicted RNA-binding protein with PIN domain